MSYNATFNKLDAIEYCTNKDLMRVIEDIDKPINYNIYCIHKDEYWKFNEDIIPISRILRYEDFLILFIREDTKYIKFIYKLITDRFMITVYYYKSELLNYEQLLFDYEINDYIKRYLELIKNHLTKCEEKL